MNLITGATGHIGNVLARQLRASGQAVRALVLPMEDLTPIADLDLEIYPGDVLEPESIQNACHGVDTVYHLAGLISIMPGKNNMVQRVNIEGTRNVLDACSKANIRRLVYTSSIHALGRPDHGIQIDEAIPFDPSHAISDYDYSKACASLEVLAACERGLNAVLACPTGVIGPWDYRLSELGAIIRSAVKGKPQFYVDGAYDFVDVRDVAQGLQMTAARGKTGQSYILSGEQLSVQRLIKTLWELTGGHFKHFRIPNPLANFAAHFTPVYYRLARIRPRFTPYSLATLNSNSNISHARASKELGYHPRPLLETLRDTVAWFDHRLHLGA